MALDNYTFYKLAYMKYGITPLGLNWNSKNSQEIRFSILTKLLTNDLAKSTIIDAGCGFGDLYLFWIKNSIKCKSYHGIDSIQDFIHVAYKQTKTHDNCTFTCRDILKDDLQRADWYVASGSLNILSDFDTWLFLEKMLAYSNKGIIFNILTRKKRSENFNYKSQKDIVDFAKEKGLNVQIINNYLPNDMTVKISK